MQKYKTQKKEPTGHILRHDSLIKTGMVEGKRYNERAHLQYLQQIMCDINCGAIRLMVLETNFSIDYLRRIK